MPTASPTRRSWPATEVRPHRVAIRGCGTSGHVCFAAVVRDLRNARRSGAGAVGFAIDDGGGATNASATQSFTITVLPPAGDLIFRNGFD